mmetsp:Transcript_38391/g.110301  ORF Transcript_38391/g.110301 Transcript_38391/m.110301 type:complete len:240 (-) Transcript_38391:1288-2007(-)
MRLGGTPTSRAALVVHVGHLLHHVGLPPGRRRLEAASFLVEAEEKLGAQAMRVQQRLPRCGRGSRHGGCRCGDPRFAARGGCGGGNNNRRSLPTWLLHDLNGQRGRRGGRVRHKADAILAVRHEHHAVVRGTFGPCLNSGGHIKGQQPHLRRIHRGKHRLVGVRAESDAVAAELHERGGRAPLSKHPVDLHALARTDDVQVERRAHDPRAGVDLVGTFADDSVVAQQHLRPAATLAPND